MGVHSINPNRLIDVNEVLEHGISGEELDELLQQRLLVPVSVSHGARYREGDVIEAIKLLAIRQHHTMPEIDTREYTGPEAAAHYDLLIGEMI